MVEMSRGQQLGRASAVGAHSLRLVFEMLNAGDGELDERLHKDSNRSGTPRGVPERLPRLVRFPVVAVVEQVQAAQVRPAFAPARGVESGGQVISRAAKTVPGVVRDGMRRAAWNVCVRRKR